MSVFSLICFCLCVRMYKYTQVQAAGSQSVGLLINQMSRRDENLIPGRNLGNNTLCHRNLMHAWRRPAKLKEGGKQTALNV